MGTGVLIPYLVGRTVDEIRDGGDEPVAARARGGRRRRAAAACSACRAGSWPGRVSLGVEYDLRNRMYQHLQSLELGFFDAQQTGQLMSRATVDLQAVRFFLGYGLIFILQSALTILIAGGVMLALNPWLALVALAPMPFVDLDRLPVRAPQPPGRAGGAAADRRADRGGRGEHRRRARREGVRAGGAPAAPLQRARSSACSTSRWCPRGCAPSTRRSSASCPSSGWPRCCSSAASR